MNWYHRTLLSYAPIFFVVFSVMIFALFSVINKSAQDQVQETQKAVMTQAIRTMDVNLRAVERTALKEMLNDGGLKSFFDAQDNKSMYDYFVLSQNLYALSQTLPFANSIYLYNESNRKVMTLNGLYAIDEFTDKAFLTERYGGPANAGWSEPRYYREFAFERDDMQVVSLVRRYPLSLEKQGALVVNVYLNDLNRFIREFMRHDSNTNIRLYTADFKPMGTGSGDASAGFDANDASVIRSGYTGWYMAFGGKFDYELSFARHLTDVWMLVGFVVIVAGLVGFTYVTHRNYKPIQSIAGKLGGPGRQKSAGPGRRGTRDELKFIESGINGLLDKTIEYEKNHKSDLLIKKKQWFVETMEGHRLFADEEWRANMEKLQLPAAARRFSTAVIELDRYASFTGQYSERDQYLFKYAIGSVLKEIADKETLSVWNEWIEPNQMGVLFIWNDFPHEERAVHTIRRLQEWMAEHLNFTVSAALGFPVAEIGELHRSYDEAKGNILFKPAFGASCLILKEHMRAKPEVQIFPHLQTINEISKCFRLGDRRWTTLLDGLFQTFRDNLFSRKEIGHVASYLIFQFHKEMMELPEEINAVWKQEYMPQLEAVVGRAELLDEYHDRMSALLVELETKLHDLRFRQRNHEMVLKAKAWIDEQYGDCDFSLNSLSDRLGVNPRYLSKLFKEQIGEKFIDYLIRIRMEKAKRLLLETNDSVQDVGEQVGYTHVISFHRAFKKLYDLSPGDYRHKEKLV